MLGETINTLEKIEKEAKAFWLFLHEWQAKHQSASPSLEELLYKFADRRAWQKELDGGDYHASDIRALWFYLMAVDLEGQRYLQDPSSREQKIGQLIRGYAKDLEPRLTRITNEQQEEIDYWWEKRTEALDICDKATNESERIKLERQYFYPAQKGLQKACGFTSCAARDCLEIVRSTRRKYHSDSCRQREKSKRWREKNPGAKKKADKKYLDSLEPQDFSDGTEDNS